MMMNAAKRDGNRQGGNNLEKMIKKFQSYFEPALASLSTVDGDSTIFFLGNSDSGKSTCIAYLMGAPLKRVKRNTRFIMQNLAENEGYPVIGNKRRSETAHPRAYSVEKGRFVLCDCPGFADSRTFEQVVVTNVTTELAIKKSGEVKGIAVVIDINDFTIRNADAFTNLIETLAKLLKNFDSGSDFNEQLKKSIVFMFNKVASDIGLTQIVADIEASQLECINDLNDLDQLSTDGDDEHDLLAAAKLRLELKVYDLILDNRDNMLIIDPSDDGASRETVFAKLEKLKPVDKKETFVFDEYCTERVNFAAAVEMKIKELTGLVSSLLKQKGEADNLSLEVSKLEQEEKDLTDLLDKHGQLDKRLATSQSARAEELRKLNKIAMDIRLNDSLVQHKGYKLDYLRSGDAEIDSVTTYPARGEEPTTAQEHKISINAGHPLKSYKVELGCGSYKEDKEGSNLANGELSILYKVKKGERPNITITTYVTAEIKHKAAIALLKDQQKTFTEKRGKLKTEYDACLKACCEADEIYYGFKKEYQKLNETVSAQRSEVDDSSTMKTIREKLKTLRNKTKPETRLAAGKATYHLSQDVKALANRRAEFESIETVITLFEAKEAPLNKAFLEGYQSFLNLLRQQKSSELVAELPADFHCGITGRLLVEPVSLATCHHLFEKTELDEYIEKLNQADDDQCQCPHKQCQTSFTRNDIAAASSIKEQLDSYRQSQQVYGQVCERLATETYLPFGERDVALAAVQSEIQKTRDLKRRANTKVDALEEQLQSLEAVESRLHKNKRTAEQAVKCRGEYAGVDYSFVYENWFDGLTAIGLDLKFAIKRLRAMSEKSECLQNELYTAWQVGKLTPSETDGDAYCSAYEKLKVADNTFTEDPDSLIVDRYFEMLENGKLTIGLPGLLLLAEEHQVSCHIWTVDENDPAKIKHTEGHEFAKDESRIQQVHLLVKSEPNQGLRVAHMTPVVAKATETNSGELKPAFSLSELRHGFFHRVAQPTTRRGTASTPRLVSV